jgi:hypothetical protein
VPSEPTCRRVVPFRADMIDAIADAVAAVPELAPFQLPGGSVYQLTLQDATGKPTALLTLWPTQHRVDAIAAAAAIVFTRVATVQLVDGVEIIFTRENGDYLIVSHDGRIVVRC